MFAGKAAARLRRSLLFGKEIELTIFIAAHPIVHVNASLNTLAAVLLLVGLYLIKTGRVEAHKRTMLSAFAVSAVFLACYLWYHYQVQHVRFTHSGPVRYVYYSILASHVVLAVTVPFLAIRQIYLGFRALGCCSPPGEAAERAADAARYRDKHVRLARWTFPIWLYVSVTGVIVYVMIYHLWPPAGP
jgi:putative membrane protein